MRRKEGEIKEEREGKERRGSRMVRDFRSRKLFLGLRVQ